MEIIEESPSGEQVASSGDGCTARDQAIKALTELVESTTGRKSLVIPAVVDALVRVAQEARGIIPAVEITKGVGRGNK